MAPTTMPCSLPMVEQVEGLAVMMATAEEAVAAMQVAPSGLAMAVVATGEAALEAVAAVAVGTQNKQSSHCIEPIHTCEPSW